MCDALLRADLPVETGACLRDFTTFRIGGKAAALVVVTEPGDVVTVLGLARRLDVLVRCLGGGSNVLASDDGVPGVTLVNRIGHLAFEGETVGVGGGYPWDDLVQATCERGYAGMSSMSGIPGSVGGAIYGNAGAYGESVSDVLVCATVVNPDGGFATLTSDELGFRYRHSRLKVTGQIVVDAVFRLTRDDRVRLAEHRDTILATRAAKLPAPSVRTAGSFFKNIEDHADRQRLVGMLGLPDSGHRIAAGLLLDRVGARGMSVGDAMVFENHANIIVNRGNATARDVLRLSHRMRRMVQQAFAVNLEREVMWLGGPEPDTGA